MLLLNQWWNYPAYQKLYSIIAKKRSVPEAVAQKKIYLSYVSEETGTRVSFAADTKEAQL